MAKKYLNFSDSTWAYILASLAIILTLVLIKPTITGAQTAQIQQCAPNWQCGTWSACVQTGTQTRICSDSNNCGNNTNKPAETQTCTPPTMNLKGDIIVAAENISSGVFSYLGSGDRIQRKQRARVDVLVLYENTQPATNVEIKRIFLDSNNKELENATQVLTQSFVFSANDSQLRQFKAGEINGSFVSAQFNINPRTDGKLPNGQYTVRLIVDPDNKIPETDETDNIKEFKFEVIQATDTTAEFSKSNISAVFLASNATKSVNIKPITKADLQKLTKERFSKPGFQMTSSYKQSDKTKKEKKITPPTVYKRYTSLFRAV